MTVLLNNTLKKKRYISVDEHETPLIPIYISLVECIRSKYNKYGDVTKNITLVNSQCQERGQYTTEDFCSLLCMLQPRPRPLPMARYWHYLLIFP